MVPRYGSSTRWRIGLLITTIAMGVALASTGISGYAQARKNADTITQVEVMGVLRGLRREISRPRGNPFGEIDTFLTESGEQQGINYVAIFAENGARLAEFGKAEQPLSENLIDEAAARLRGRRAKSPEPAAIRRISSEIVHAAVPVPRRMSRRKHPLPESPAVIAFEITSVAGPRAVSTALFSLIIELGASALLLLASVLFWRQSHRAETHARAMEAERQRMRSQLERDKRLKALGRMSAVLGHELKNPIAALKGHAQLLLERLPADHPDRKQARTVVTEAELLEKLTAQVLEFVRTGEITLSKVYLDDLAFGAVALANVEQVRVSVPQETVWYLDRPRMEEALTNLLINARQASAPDDPIDLTLVPGEAALEITIRDRGEGIPPGEEERIFQPFHTRKVRGTGLGLALVKRIVEAHGGTVSARNHKDRGAVITVSLPRTSSGGENG